MGEFKTIHDTYLDFIYRGSSLNHFMETHRVTQPRFELRVDPIEYLTCDQYTTEARMPLHKLEQIKKEHGLDENSAFIETLVLNARKELEDYFMKYVDVNAEVIDLTYYHQNHRIDFANLFRRNSRASLKNKGAHMKRDLKKGAYFLGVLMEIYKENKFLNDSPYLVVSEDMAQFIASSVNEFSKATNTASEFIQNISQYDEDLMRPIGIIELERLGNLYVVLNKRLPENTMYYGSRNPTGLALFYNITENPITSFTTYPDPGESVLDIEKVYRLNMFHAIGVINKIPQFKKLNFNNVAD